jgi:hypothetical protein
VTALRLQQKCPFCDEMLDYDATTDAGTKNDKGGVDFTISAQTTPESTAHVWTHAPELPLGAQVYRGTERIA